MSVSKQPDKRTFTSRRKPIVRFGVVFLLLFGIALWLLSTTVQDRPLIATVHDPAQEMVALAKAMRAYQAKHGELPPSVVLSEESLRATLKKRFPGLSAEEIVPPVLDPAEALVLWLGGFSLNPEFPLSGDGGPMSLDTPRRAGFYEFDPKRLVLTSHGKKVYLPPGIGRTEPYVYFQTSGAAEQEYPTIDPRIKAYRQTDGTYVNADSFQILSAGEDDEWGDLSGPVYPEGPFTGGHADNRANFAAEVLGSEK